MAILTDIFFALTTNTHEYSGTTNTRSLALNAGTAALAQVNFAGAIGPGTGTIDFAALEFTVDSDAVTSITFGLRGGNLLEPTGVLIWGRTNLGKSVPLHRSSPIGSSLSTDQTEGDLTMLLPRFAEGGPGMVIELMVMALEVWAGPNATIIPPEPTPALELRVTRADGTVLGTEPLVGSGGLRPGQAGIWSLRAFPPFTAPDAAAYSLRNIGAAAGSYRLAALIGLGNQNGQTATRMLATNGFEVMLLGSGQSAAMIRE